MDIRKVKKLIELLDESGIAELEITEGEESVRISRYPQGVPVAPQAPQPAYGAPAQASPPPGATAAVPTKDKEEEGHVVLAPMVGTFYASPRRTSRAVRHRRPGGQGRRHAGHHRGDEDVQPDRGRRRPAPCSR